MILTPKNWNSFQHYKDRSPPWIKLHRGLIDNHDYHRLTPEAAKYLPLIWIIASERDGIVPAGAELAFRLRIDDDLANDIVVELMAANFLVEGNAETAEQTATLAQRVAKSNGFGKRHISDLVKRAVWARDAGKCQQCGSTENVEYDHKVPVSKGGNSEESNIQLLCRPCNRAKRKRLATPAQPLRSLETETETETEKEKISVAKATGAEAPRSALPTRLVTEPEVYRLGREVLGKNCGGVITNLRKHCRQDLREVRDLLEQARDKGDPMEWVQGVLRGTESAKLSLHQIFPEEVYRNVL